MCEDVMKTIAVAALAAALVVAGCSGGNDKRITPANLPLVEPPVEAATPPGLLPSSPGALVISEFKSRFFEPSPTEVLGLLGAIDGRIAEINRRSLEEEHPCLEQEPVAYEIQAFGDTVTFYAQCYERVTTPQTDSRDPALVQFGTKDGVTYLYYAIWEGRAAAIVTPVDGAPGEYVVRAWMGVGYMTTPYDGGSYAAMSLRADSHALTYELAVAGIAVGYCGAQLASDGTNVYAIGSEDSDFGCATPSDLCVAASDLAPSDSGACDALKVFALPALGREATADGAHAASGYPGGELNTIVLDGTATDSLHFGPVEPTPGVAAF